MSFLNPLLLLIFAGFWDRGIFGMVYASDRKMAESQDLSQIVNFDEPSTQTSRSTRYSLSYLWDRHGQKPLPEPRLRADRQTSNPECTHTVATQLPSQTSRPRSLAMTRGMLSGIWLVNDARGLLCAVATYGADTLLVEEHTPPSRGGRCRLRGHLPG